MARFLVLLDPSADESDRDDAINAVMSNGGEIVAVFDPNIVVAEGDETAQDAAGEFLGISVLGVDEDGSIDPSGLGLPTELEALVALWTLQFTPAVQAALANRFRDGEEWDFPGPCTAE